MAPLPIARSVARAWLAKFIIFFFLIKRNKNQVSKNASLPHMAFALQNAMRRGYVTLRRTNLSFH